ncbi:MAG: alpha/beta fold hydrolase [Chitinophagaceae bacterium]
MKVVISAIKILVVGYILLCLLLYFVQEKLIFFPEKLAANYQFSFSNRFESINIKTKDNAVLNGLLFKADSAKGLIFYLHGNAGSLASWGEIANTYTSLGYDLFMLDYRGYGKSSGSINNQQQFFDDVQLAYDSLKLRYKEDKIIVLGYSIGTGAATWLASANKPSLLILQAPYFSLTDMMNHRFYILPSFILKYKFPTNKYLPLCTMPVVIFHGDKDEVIYYGSSLKLKTLLKPSDSFITLKEQGHNGITENLQYLAALKNILK